MKKLLLIIFLSTAILVATESSIDEEIIKNIDFFMVMETVETDEIFDDEFEIFTEVEESTDDDEDSSYGGYNG